LPLPASFSFSQFGESVKTDAIAVCIIVENLPVPLDRRVWQEARALAEAGYRVSVICPKGPGFERSRETLEGIDIYRHRLPEGRGPLGYAAEYSWALAAELWLALRIFARTRFRILHAANPPDTIFLIGVFFKLFGTRFVFDHHDLNPELFEAKFGRRGLLHRLLSLAERLTFRTADISIATNESYRQVALGRGGMSPDRVFIVRSAPDLRNVQLGPPQPQLKEGSRHLVLYLGVMGKQEGLDLLIKAFEHIVRQRNRQDVLFALVGDGPERAFLQELVARKGLDRFVRFTGRIPDERLACYFCTADVAVACDPKNAMNDKSTMNKILEYMAYARPVVLFDLFEGRRSADDAALYAKPNDPVDFAERIIELLDSDELRRKLGSQGRRRIEGQLNWATEKKSLLEAYRKVLQPGDP
jgi:glycosyltransferase involved in cell wall biosynthesis